jgi:hypothetical protein
MQINRKIDYHKKFSKQQQINVTIVSGKSTKIFEFFSNLKCVYIIRLKVEVVFIVCQFMVAKNKYFVIGKVKGIKFKYDTLLEKRLCNFTTCIVVISNT